MLRCLWEIGKHLNLLNIVFAHHSLRIPHNCFPMKHIYWIIEKEIAGRPGPDLEPWKPKALYEGGFRAVLSLNGGRDVDTADLEKAGLEHFSLAIPITEPPQAEGIMMAVDLLPKAYAWVDQKIRQAKPVLVHCFHGNDRTGLFLFYFLVLRHGCTPYEAMRKLKTIRPSILIAFGWENLAYELIPKLIKKDV